MAFCEQKGIFDASQGRNALLWAATKTTEEPTEHQVTNVAEVKRKLARLQKAGEELAKLPLTPEGVRREVPAIVLLTQRFTQRPQKFIRWIRTFLTSNLPWAPLVASLKALFAIL